MIKDIVTHKGEKFELTFTDSTNFSNLKLITQVYGVCFNKDGKIAIINVTGDWCLPGGSIEKGETFEQALIREVDEEADIEIEKLEAIGYIETTKEKDKSKSHQLRYAALITKIKKQTIDPAYNKIPERKFIKPEDFLKYCPWGNTGKAMIEKAVKWFSQKSQQK